MENRGYAFYEKIKKPRFVVAPMVDQSELAYRLLTRRYGAELAYTPMLHSRLMVEDKTYMDKYFSTCPEDRPLIVQFCGNEPDTLLSAAKLVEPHCDAVDINLGCPQGIARKGNYGAFLLSQKETIKACVENLAKNLSIPVTCKMRILPNEEETIKLAEMIQDAGASLLTVHGRTKEQNKHLVGNCNWDIIKKIKERLHIPVIANGGIYSHEDVLKCIEYTKCDGVMSSESILDYPALFSGHELHDLDDLSLEYLDIAKKHDVSPDIIRGHLFKFLYSGLKVHTDLREQLTTEKEWDGFYSIVNEMKKRRSAVPKTEKRGWYHRYFNEGANNNADKTTSKENEGGKESGANVDIFKNNDGNGQKDDQAPVLGDLFSCE